jgi:hypothetical protein
MTIEKARKILGKKAENYTDEQIQEILNTLTVLADIAIDQAVAKPTENTK